MKLMNLSTVSIDGQLSFDKAVFFFSADKHKSFLQLDSITLGVCNQPCANYSKKQVYYFLEVS